MTASESIKYTAGSKYQLQEGYGFLIHGEFTGGYGWARVAPVGEGMSRVYLRKGYAWDGASGPVRDNNEIMRGSLMHDALYQLIRRGVLPKEFKEQADDILYRACLEDGMFSPKAWLVRKAVGMFGGMFLQRGDEKEVLCAPN